ncbi:MAG: sulfatase-like hydrolase/transferase [Kiritimatiellia bacterium]|jgi:arylsulfatase A-like enzyme|nr:sulfatase-like hydrolase/transferase [Kiritimatiellia bacterium]MDP6811369.1 sulfatase-like hydrolase/transferase [Kiritimatiellia bacterium]MDP7024927.1 sulfatase-like hydrolase/transferase [Kiritimatiellia bacterium]
MNRPNIILILTDHFRRDTLRPDITPTLCQLAGSGTNFANAYSAAPLCQPARNSIITGMHPTATGICGNQSPPIDDSLRDDTFMNHLQNAGYYTAMIGKHHYIDRYGIGMDVTADAEEIRKYGFDHVFQVNDDGENLHNDDEYTRWLADNGKLDQFRATDAWATSRHPFPADETADGFIGVNGIRFVKDYKDDKPFYLNLSFIGPHPPFWHPAGFDVDLDQATDPIGVKESGDVRERRTHYLAKCRLIDHYVAGLLQALEEREMRQNTVILFTADHGDCLGDFDIWDKRFFYEASVGVPLFVCGGQVESEARQNGARISKALVSHLDLYPTVLGLAGLDTEPDRRRPGRDLLRIARGADGGHKYVVSELATAMMIRTGNWKLVFDPQAGGVQQLFNLVRDPDELDNLAGAAGYESITAQLVEKLLADKIRRSQFTHVKEEQRLQRAHIA